MAGRIAPSVGSGTIISSFGNGTRLGCFRITTTAPSLKYLQANITWTFDSLLYGYVTKFESFINDLPMDITIEQFHQNNYIFDNYSYEAKLLNDVQVLLNQYEFDIYLKQTGSIPIEVHNSQCVLVFDDTVSSGGILSAIYIPGTSEMNSSQIPGNPNVSSVFGSKRVFKIAGINSTGQGSGTILSSTGNGTRLGRFRIITTARAFAVLR